MTLKVNEIFKGIQGEGCHQGRPVLFVRLAGCTRKCKFCDTTYHTNFKEMTVASLVKIIKKSKTEIVVWTGGEPLLQVEGIQEVVHSTRGISHHLESNGDIINTLADVTDYILPPFNYICISPKELKVAKKINKLLFKPYVNYNLDQDADIKIVTDLETVGVDMLKYATTIMPLTTHNKKKDQLIRQKVWEYCVQHNKHYSARLHVQVWNQTKKK